MASVGQILGALGMGLATGTLNQRIQQQRQAESMWNKMAQQMVAEQIESGVDPTQNPDLMKGLSKLVGKERATEYANWARGLVTSQKLAAAAEPTVTPEGRTVLRRFEPTPEAGQRLPAPEKPGFGRQLLERVPVVGEVARGFNLRREEMEEARSPQQPLPPAVQAVDTDVAEVAARLPKDATAKLKSKNLEVTLKGVTTSGVEKNALKEYADNRVKGMSPTEARQVAESKTGGTIDPGKLRAVDENIASEYWTVAKQQLRKKNPKASDLELSVAANRAVLESPAASGMTSLLQRQQLGPQLPAEVEAEAARLGGAPGELGPQVIGAGLEQRGERRFAEGARMETYKERLRRGRPEKGREAGGEGYQLGISNLTNRRTEIQNMLIEDKKKELTIPMKQQIGQYNRDALRIAGDMYATGRARPEDFPRLLKLPPGVRQGDTFDHLEEIDALPLLQDLSQMNVLQLEQLLATNMFSEEMIRPFMRAAMERRARQAQLRGQEIQEPTIGSIMGAQ